MEKEFFWKDKSGRGLSNVFGMETLKEAFNEPEDVDYDGESAIEWAEEAEVGDEWENATHKLTRTK